MRRSRHSILALGLAVALFAAACGTSENVGTVTTDTSGAEDTTTTASGATDTTQASVEGRAVVIGLPDEPPTLDPLITQGFRSDPVNRAMFEALFEIDVDGQLQPQLAAGPAVQIDDLTWEVKIRDNVRFHNGEVLDAAAVANAINLTQSEQLQAESELTPTWVTFAGAEVIDDTTVHVFTIVVDPLLPVRLIRVPIVPPEYYETGDIGSQPIGTGPYQFVSWTRGSNLVVERWDDYWGDVPAASEVEFRFLPEPSSRSAALLAGEVDVVLDLPLSDVQRVPVAKAAQFYELLMVMLNSSGGVTESRLVRQALSLAINREDIAAIYPDGTIEQVAQLLSSTWFGYDNSLPPLEYDPDTARRLLDEAGATGATVRFVGTSGIYPTDRQVAEIITEYWNQVGVEVQLELPTFEEWISIWRDDSVPRSDALYFQTSNELLDADKPYTRYYGSATLDRAGVWNDDLVLGALVDEARSESDPAQREALYAEIARIGLEEMYAIPVIAVPAYFVGLSDDVEWQPRLGTEYFLVQDVQPLP